MFSAGTITDIAGFRAAFPEFGSDTTYPDAALNFWTGFAALYCDPCKWSTAYDQGMGLALTHFLVLSGTNQNGTPGTGTGLINSQGGGPISVSFDTQSVSEQGAAQWNLTNYGTRFFQLARMISGGAVQLC